MKRRFDILLSLLAVLLLPACSDDASLFSPQAGEVITLAAVKQPVITRAGDEVTTFDAGTKYHLFALEHADTYNWSSPTIDAEGAETESHTIDYGSSATYPATGSLDFFGVTYGNATKPEIVSTTTPPSVELEVDNNGALPDLMYSNNLKGCTSKDGQLQMNFRHTLSMLTFEIVKQDAEELGEVTLSSITVQGSHSKGNFQLETGSWTYVDGDIADRTFFSGELPVGTTVQEVPGEMLLFPNASDETVSVHIRLTGKKLDPSKTVKGITYQLLQADGTTPFLFEPNKKYKLTITVLNNDVRIVAILPQVYEWIDIDYTQKDQVTSDTDIYLGQPVTFGNLMWMDRNLGAKTADCENDFYNSIGYYYQFGRNIPYILDVEKWKVYTNDKDEKNFLHENGTSSSNGPHIMAKGYSTYGSLAYYSPAEREAMTDEQKDYIAQCQYECMYTRDHEGKVVYGYSTTSHTETSMVRFPGDVVTNDDANYTITRERYKFVAGSRSSWTEPANLNQNYWSDVENHPCPKGWRLPTKDDLYSFMPRNQLNWNSRNYPYNYVNANYKEEGRYGRVANPDGTTYNVIYLLKNKGTEDAYRVRIISRFSKNNAGTGYSKNKRYVRISRYPAGKDDTIEDFVGDGKEDTEWNNPVETTDFPGAGFLITDGMPDLRTFGQGSVLRTSEPAGTSTNWVLYLSVTDFQVSVQSGSRRSLGDQIRCVRDINLKE